MTKPERYISDVLKGKIKTGHYAELAVRRHVQDLKRKKFAYHFDHDVGLSVIRQMEAFEHPEGKLIGRQFELAPWQAFIVYVVFGWKDKAGYRRFKYVYIEVAKKNGKTAFAALVALFLMIMDGESNAEIYSFATGKEQAKICFEDCKKMLEHMVMRIPTIRSRFWIGKTAVAYYPTASRIAPMANDRKQGRKDGIRAHGGICDEYHAHSDNSVFEQVKSSMVNRDQPLMWIITTAGFNKMGPCYVYRGVVIEILEGKITNEITFGIIYTLDAGDDIADESNWFKSNPSLGVPGCVTLKNLREEYNDALSKGKSFEVNFITKNLNQWTDSDEVWLADRVWQKNFHLVGNKPAFSEKDLLGKTCYGGLDLASGVDFNAFTLLFPELWEFKGKKISPILSWYWKPSELINDKRQKRDFRQWVADGHILDTPGEIIQWDFVSTKIMQLTGQYNIHSISFDPYRANHGVLQELMAYGIKCYELAQVMSHLSEPTSRLETLATNGQLEHFSNPVTRWMMGNVKIIIDSKGNIMVSKGKSKGQVDGIASLVNAIGDWLTFKNQGTGDGFMVISTKKT